MSKNIIRFHFYEGKGIAPAIIKWRTRGIYSHVSIEINEIIYEAKEWRGVVKSNSIYTYNDIGTCTKTIEIDMQYSSFLEFRKFIQSKLGCKYDWGAILNFLGNWNKHNPDKWFCSEYGDTIFQFLPNYIAETELVSPELLYEKLKYFNLGRKSIVK